MPYSLEKVHKGYYVTDASGRRYSKKPLSKTRAEKQITALHIHTGHGDQELTYRPTDIYDPNMYSTGSRAHLPMVPIPRHAIRRPPFIELPEEPEQPKPFRSASRVKTAFPPKRSRKSYGEGKYVINTRNPLRPQPNAGEYVVNVDNPLRAPPVQLSALDRQREANVLPYNPLYEQMVREKQQKERKERAAQAEQERYDRYVTSQQRHEEERHYDVVDDLVHEEVEDEPEREPGTLHVIGQVAKDTVKKMARNPNCVSAIGSVIWNLATGKGQFTEPDKHILIGDMHGGITHDGIEFLKAVVPNFDRPGERAMTPHDLFDLWETLQHVLTEDDRTMYAELLKRGAKYYKIAKDTVTATENLMQGSPELANMHPNFQHISDIAQGDHHLILEGFVALTNKYVRQFWEAMYAFFLNIPELDLRGYQIEEMKAPPPVYPTPVPENEKSSFGPTPSRGLGKHKFAKKYLKGQGLPATKKNIKKVCDIMDVEGIVFD